MKVRLEIYGFLAQEEGAADPPVLRKEQPAVRLV